MPGRSSGRTPDKPSPKRGQNSTLLAARAAGNNIPDEPGISKSPTVAESLKDYLADVAARGNANNTVEAYRDALKLFGASHGDKPIDQVTREDLDEFGMLLRKKGDRESTIRQRMVQLITFLRRQGLDEALEDIDLPRPTTKTPDSYTEDELRRLFGACDSEDRLLFNYFLGTGYRVSEVLISTWGDSDWAARTITVRAKPALGFTPKSHEERTIPLADPLVTSLRGRRTQHPDARYIFGDGLIPIRSPKERLKSIALAAGLNCGECASKRGQSCRNHACCAKFSCRKVRRTFATLQHRNGVDARTLQHHLGHKSIRQPSGTWLRSSLSLPP